MNNLSQTWFVYILQCNDSSYYVGVATDVEDRLKEHNAGQGASFTKKRRPVKLVYKEKHERYAGARKREAQLKRLAQRKERMVDQGVPFDSSCGLAQGLTTNPGLSVTGQILYS